jgi:glycosyltransferase involved in cell wall biosynthesis
VRILFFNLNQSLAYGGVERWMMDAAVGLSARGHECVMLGRPGAPWAKAARRAGLRVREDHHGPWVSRVARTRAVMRAERPDVVVVKAKKAARMAAWGRATGGGGRVAILFGLTHELDPRRWVDRYTWRRTDAGITLAHGATRWYVEHGFGPAAKLHAMWKGVDLVPFDLGLARRPATREALGLVDDDLAIGTVCRLAWQKGIDQLMEAVRLVRPALPHARFFVVGDGRERPQIEAAAHDLGGAVTFLGQRDDVPALLSAFDVFVQPSRQEVMVQTTLEAMAAGRAIVSTSTVGADEAIEDGVSGVLVDVGDAPAMAQAIIALAGEPARRAALGRAARARIEATFTLEHMLDRAEAILGRVATGRPAVGLTGGETTRVGC